MFYTANKVIITHLPVIAFSSTFSSRYSAPGKLRPWIGVIISRSCLKVYCEKAVNDQWQTFLSFSLSLFLLHLLLLLHLFSFVFFLLILSPPLILVLLLLLLFLLLLFVLLLLFFYCAQTPVNQRLYVQQSLWHHLLYWVYIVSAQIFIGQLGQLPLDVLAAEVNYLLLPILSPCNIASIIITWSADEIASHYNKLRN